MPDDIPANGHVPRMSNLLANKADNEMIPVDMYRSPGILSKAEENPGCRLMKTVKPVITSNGIPYFPMRSEGSHSMSGREGKKTPLSIEVTICYELYCIVLMGWSLLPNALRPFQDLLCSPEFRYY